MACHIPPFHRHLGKERSVLSLGMSMAIKGIGPKIAHADSFFGHAKLGNLTGVANQPWHALIQAK